MMFGVHVAPRDAWMDSSLILMVKAAFSRVSPAPLLSLGLVAVVLLRDLGINPRAG